MHVLEQRYGDLLYQQYAAHIRGLDLETELVEEIARLEKELDRKTINRISLECMKRMKKEHGVREVP